MRLFLQEERTLAGRVVSDLGPVANATVFAYPRSGRGQPATMGVPRTRTRPDGTFRLPVPGSTLDVRLLVLAPGFLLKTVRVSEGSRLQVELERSGGGILLLESRENGRSRGASVPILMALGEPLDLPRLQMWAGMNHPDPEDGDALRVPAMPTGEYSYCHLTLSEALLVMDGAALPASEACSSGFLPPGGELRLELGGD